MDGAAPSTSADRSNLQVSRAEGSGARLLREEEASALRVAEEVLCGPARPRAGRLAG